MRLNCLEGLGSMEGLEGVKGLERLERWSWASGCFFAFLKPKNKKTGLHADITFSLFTGRLDRYLAWSPDI